MNRKVIEETLARAGLEPVSPFVPLPRREGKLPLKKRQVIEEVLTSIGLESIEKDDADAKEKEDKRLRRAV